MNYKYHQTANIAVFVQFWTVFVWFWAVFEWFLSIFSYFSNVYPLNKLILQIIDQKALSKLQVGVLRYCWDPAETMLRSFFNVIIWVELLKLLFRSVQTFKKISLVQHCMPTGSIRRGKSLFYVYRDQL